MMPLTFATIGEKNMIMRIGGGRGMKKHLEQMGFLPGSEITVVNNIQGSVIVNVKDTRIAISRGMANKIMI